MQEASGESDVMPESDKTGNMPTDPTDNVSNFRRKSKTDCVCLLFDPQLSERLRHTVLYYVRENIVCVLTLKSLQRASTHVYSVFILALMQMFLNINDLRPTTWSCASGHRVIMEPWDCGKCDHA